MWDRLSKASEAVPAGSVWTTAALVGAVVVRRLDVVFMAVQLETVRAGARLRRLRAGSGRVARP